MLKHLWDKHIRSFESVCQSFFYQCLIINSKFNFKNKKITPFHPLQQLTLHIQPPRADRVADLWCPLSTFHSIGACTHHPLHPGLCHRREISGTRNALFVATAKAGRAAGSGSADTGWGGLCWFRGGIRLPSLGSVTGKVIKRHTCRLLLWTAKLEQQDEKETKIGQFLSKETESSNRFPCEDPSRLMNHLWIHTTS